MKKIINICSAPNGVVALMQSLTGKTELYFGFWIGDGDNVPKFCWRLIPNPSGAEYKFEMAIDAANFPPIEPVKLEPVN